MPSRVMALWAFYMTVSVVMVACLFGEVSGPYSWALAAIAATAVLSLLIGDLNTRALVGFTSVYTLIGALNISSYRGAITAETAWLYLFSLMALFVGSLFFQRTNFLPHASVRLRPSKVFLLLAIIHISAAFCCVIYVYWAVGPIVIRQSLRFNLPVALEYCIKSPLILPALAGALLSFCRTGTERLITVAIGSAAVLPALLIGSRGSIVLAVISAYVSYSAVSPGFGDRGRLYKRRNFSTAPILALLAVVVISGGFYLRRVGSEELLSPAALVDQYFTVDSWWIWLIVPVYLGFRETIGITNRIIGADLTNEITAYPLFVADLVTVLPGTQTAAGQALGDIIGRVQEGGLTPGLLGALYIDFGRPAVLLFGLAGFALSAMYRIARTNPIFSPLYAVLFVNFLHLFHRGFLKPEYLTSLLLVLAYVPLLIAWSRVR